MKEIAFTYSLQNTALLKDIHLQLQKQTCILINGNENKAFTVLGAILGNILPTMELPDIESLVLLYKDFSGDIDFKKHDYSETVSYISCDPDRQLMFAEVWEEFAAQIPKAKTQHDVNVLLEKFSLNDSFYRRKIESLSGGEKMKLALCLAFAKDEEIIVMHGVVPWLDQKGREDLKNAIIDAKNKDKIIIILEQEYHCLQDIIDKVYVLKTDSLVQVDEKSFFVEAFNPQIYQHLEKLNALIANKDRDELLLKIERMSFAYQEKEIYHEMSLQLNKSSIYYLNAENGTGKTTFANILFKLEKDYQGEIELCQKDLKSYDRQGLNNCIAYVSQFPESQLIWNTIGECRDKVLTRNNTTIIELFKQYFQQSDSYPIIYLSFAEMKLLLTLMMVKTNTQLLILDEPTWSLDLESIEIWLKTTTQIYENMNITIFIISHAHGIMPLLGAKKLLISEKRIMVTNEK
ncbi:MAG: ATP-binding cassette domain-containing protein [Candidatus Cloacimonadales bacterium]|jgi:energy-coupling factor transporter ATP-binding protein EcfA2|nr:ATP-binding cassette domain-containing protein [Candidatus Cloacimonadota bacterium]MDD2649609.1 ATP-binding cassette domain-containing protein [Candidatus Cloacimonadota bacterium]MDX9976612.1 ATP-binding cassette domain-containing protein [Candidatus Cloacimonadales bacterium]